VRRRRAQGLIGQPDFLGSKLAWQVEDAAVRQGGATIAGPPQVSVPSLLETSDLTATRQFGSRDGNPGITLAGKVKCGVE